MTRKILAAVLAACAGCSSICEREPSPVVTAVSPDGRNEIRLYEAPLSVEVLRDGVPLVCRSRIGLMVNGCHLARDNRHWTVTDRSGKGRLETPSYKKSSVDLSRTEKVADFGDWGVGLVARNDGVAYRFEMKKAGEIQIDDERTDLSLPPEAQALVYRTKTIGWEEARPETAAIGSVRTDDGEAIYPPLVYTVGGKTVAVTESDLCDYPCWYLKGEGGRYTSFFPKWPKRTHYKGGASEKVRGRWKVVDEQEEWLVRTDGKRTLPWRTFVLADEPSKLCESDIVFALARPAADRDWSWVKPGKVAWDWWNAFDNLGDPEGCTTKTYERFIDFASVNGVEYVIFDEGWSEKLDIWSFHPNVDVPHLVDYAAKRNVGIILWMAWAQVVGDEVRVAESFAKLGVKGFKVDFMDRADADVERFLWTFAEECAKHRLLIDYHGMHRPTGLSRTYPNVLNYEGIHGLEQMKWYRNDYDMAANDIGAFFGRLTAGPMDYTPGAMDNYPLGRYPEAKPILGSNHTTVFMNPGSVGTRCHQMAMMTMYEAPLQMLADAPSKYERNMECFRFMAATPVVWSDTVGLGGAFNTYAACARRAKDGVWHAAALNGAEGRVITVDTKFLGKGEWTMEIFCDAEDAGTNPTRYRHETKRVSAGERILVEMAPGGGFAARFVRIF